jgi:hypothetical protein
MKKFWPSRRGPRRWLEKTVQITVRKVFKDNKNLMGFMTQTQMIWKRVLWMYFIANNSWLYIFSNFYGVVKWWKFQLAATARQRRGGQKLRVCTGRTFQTQIIKSNSRWAHEHDSSTDVRHRNNYIYQGFNICRRVNWRVSCRCQYQLPIFPSQATSLLAFAVKMRCVIWGRNRTEKNIVF